MSHGLHISKRELERQSNKIFSVVRNGDSAVVECYPVCRMSYNLGRFLSDGDLLKRHLGKYYQKHVLIMVVLDEQEKVESFTAKVGAKLRSQKVAVTKEASLAEMCETVIEQGREPYFLLMQEHEILTEDLAKVLRLVHTQVEQFPRVGAMVFLEKNAQVSPIKNVLKPNYKFMRNWLDMPIYSRKESLEFIKVLAKEWEVGLKNGEDEFLVDQFGGVLWLLREGVRVLRDKKVDSLDAIVKTSGIEMRLEYLEEAMGENREVMARVLGGDVRVQDKASIDYLLRMGLVTPKSGGGFEPFGQVMLDRMKVVKQGMDVRVVKGQVWLDDRNVTGNFTLVQIELLALLRGKRAALVTREEVAKVLWGKKWSDKYSDWAIDKAVSRLRKVLRELGVSPKVVKTLKGRGFLWE